MKEDYRIIHKTTCTTEGATGAGLYQFAYMTTDGKASLLSSHLVCRVGEPHIKGIHIGSIVIYCRDNTLGKGNVIGMRFQGIASKYKDSL